MSKFEEEKITKKVLLMGLDNSGKTSILISLSKNSNILSFCSLKPTNKIAISNIDTGDTIMNIWDFGGQEAFRKGHLENLERYLNEVDRIIFVIDVQDIKRYMLAVDYLTSIVNTVKKHEIKTEFSIFLHKYDPNLTNFKEFKDIDTVIESELLKPIKEIFSSEYKYEISTTCIYSVFQKCSIL